MSSSFEYRRWRDLNSEERASRMHQRLQALEGRQQLRQLLATMPERERRSLLARYSEVSTRFREIYLRLAIEGFAMTDGATQADSALKQQLGMHDAGIDLDLAEDQVNMLTQVRSYSLLLEHFGFDGATRDHLLVRYISAIIPLRDGHPPSAPRRIALPIR